MDTSLTEKLGLKREEMEKIKEESKFIPVSREEIKLVNRYTTIDVRWLYDKKSSMSYKSLKFRMIKGKADDYRFFVRMYEKYGGLPRKVYEYLNSYPFCGATKIKALKKRFGDVNIVQECTYQTMTYAEYKAKNDEFLNK